MSAADAVLWHDLECGGYAEDLPLWRELADDEAGDDPVARRRRGHRPGRARPGRATATTSSRSTPTRSCSARCATGRPPRASPWRRSPPTPADFDLGDRRFALVIVPMQTVQLLGGAEGRLGFLARARAHLRPGGVLAARDRRRARRRDRRADRAAAARPARGRRDAVLEPAGRAARRGRSASSIERLREIVDALGRAHRRRPTSSASTTSTPPRSRPRRARPACARSRRRVVPRPTSTSARRWWSSVAERTLRVCALYPELMNIYADRGNLLLLERRCAWRGLGFTATAATLGDRVDPDAHDLFYLGGGQDRDQALCARDLVDDQARGAARRGRPRRGRPRRVRRLPAARPQLRARRRGAARASGLVDLRTVREDGPRLIGNVAIEVSSPGSTGRASSPASRTTAAARTSDRARSRSAAS